MSSNYFALDVSQHGRKYFVDPFIASWAWQQKKQSFTPLSIKAKVSFFQESIKQFLDLCENLFSPHKS